MHDELKDQGYDKEEAYFKKLEREAIEKMKKKKNKSPRLPLDSSKPYP